MRRKVYPPLICLHTSGGTTACRVGCSEQETFVKNTEGEGGAYKGSSELGAVMLLCENFIGRARELCRNFAERAQLSFIFSSLRHDDAR